MALKALSTPGLLEGEHADGFERVRTALYLAGIDTGTTDPWHATRTKADQIALFKRNYTTAWVPGRSYSDGGIKNWDGRKWYRRPYKPVTAIPGTSNHGNGDTVDFQGLGGYDSATWKRAATILREHGWNNTEGRKINEPWHWTRVSTADKHRYEEVVTVSDLKDIKAALARIESRQASALTGNTEGRYEESGLATEVARLSGTVGALTPVRYKFVAVYAQAILYGVRHIIKQLDRIITKIGA